MPLYRGTNERGALALGLAANADEDLAGCDAVILWGPGAPPKGAKFVAVWDSLVRPEHGKPNVVIPDVSFAETQGSYMNVEGRVQFLRPVLDVQAPLREGWEVLSAIGQHLGASADYVGIFQLQREVAEAEPALAALADPPAATPPPTPVLYGPARP
jgi:NADH dehydrogenase/NADH:ubiquinone oxidoreductase subunit G